jgi:hypothetical protein
VNDILPYPQIIPPRSHSSTDHHAFRLGYAVSDTGYQSRCHGSSLLTRALPIGESQDAYNQVYNGEGQQNESSFGHELIAGGAAFAGFKAFEDHQRNEGKAFRAPVPSHHYWTVTNT